MSVRSILDTTGKISTAYLPAAADIDLISPINLFPASPYTSGVPTITINGNDASEYGGSITLNPGSNAVAGSSQVGVNIKSTPTGCSVELGTNGATGSPIRNYLYIAGGLGLSEVYNPAYNPVLPYVEANPGDFTSTPEAINNAAPANTIRTIPLGDTPLSYNLFQVFLDIDTTLSYNADQPLIRIYLSDSINGAYDATKAITTWVQPALQPSGDPIKLSDIPLFFSGVPATRNLYINITFANSPLPEDINANFSDTTTDYSIIAQSALSMAVPN
jgi:hypothetical protein